MDQRTMARLAAVQAIYAQELNADTASDAKHLLDANHQKRMNKKMFEGILAAVGENAAEIDNLIAANLSAEWTMTRLDKILKAVLRAAIAEIKFAGTDKNLAISEYVLIADSFYEGDEPKFVNAVLDKIN
jgi:N utilization substance protein B